MSGFKKATKRQSKARVALDGPSGSGKTYTGLITATALANGGKVAVIDSERGSASKYADQFEFDVLELEGNFAPARYRSAIAQAITGGYDVLLIDSLTHAWNGKGGVLEIVDAAKSRFGGNQWSAWSVGTPEWQSLIDAIVQAPIHVIATMRSKTTWVETQTGNKKNYERAGTEPQAREGIEYEFDVVGDIDLSHKLIVSKSRAGGRIDATYQSPGPEFGKAILAWLTEGAPADEAPPARPAAPAPAPADDGAADPISDAQRAHLFAFAKEAQVDSDTVRVIARMVFGHGVSEMVAGEFEHMKLAIERYVNGGDAAKDKVAAWIAEHPDALKRSEHDEGQVDEKAAA